MHLPINEDYHLTEFRPSDKGACVQHLSDRDIYDRTLRITAHVFESNLASARVLEKNGFVCEGHLRKHFLKDGQFIDKSWIIESGRISP
jgi:RimJ/RimL family protein N-acetyltransferase